MVWLMNVPREKLGTEFNLQGGYSGAAVVFSRREGTMDADHVGIFTQTPSEIRFVEVDETEPEHVMSTIQANTELRGELERLKLIPQSVEAA